MVTPGDDRFSEFASLFPPNAGTRAFVYVMVHRVSDSCGFSVPFYDYVGHRDTLDRWATSKAPEELEAYRATKNQRSIDGLPAFMADDPPAG